MINAFLSAILQVLAFSLIPLIVYLIRFKKFAGFFESIGIKRSNTSANLYALLLMLFMATPLLLLAYFDDGFRDIMTNPKSITGNIRQMGFSINTVVIVLLTAIVKTGLAEEIFFRGFIAKGLIALTNFVIGNCLQAILFGLLHAAIFYTITQNPFFLTLIFLIPAVSSFIKVYLNEKLANGSIVPGWIAHASANVVAYSVVGFLM